MKRTYCKIAAAAVFMVLSFPLYAIEVPGGMKTLADSIRDILTGDFVKVILACFLAGSAIAYAFNKDNEKIKRNALAIGIGAAILISAQFIIDTIWTASGGK